jgi:hypothetical protein
MKRTTPKEVWLHHHERTGWTFSFDPPLKRHELRMHRMVSAEVVAHQCTEIRALRKVVVELLKANAFGMSVTGGWEEAHLDPIYLQCARADRLGRAALAPKRKATR